MKILQTSLDLAAAPARLAYVGCALLVIAVAAACGGSSENGPSDAQLKRDITAALDRANLKTVAVQVIEGVATLTGTVPDQASADTAVQLARGVTGVKDVLSQVTVEVPVAAPVPSIAPPETPDELLAARLRLALAANTRLAGSRIDVTVLNGVAIMTGTVPSEEAKAAAEKVAVGVADLRSVESRLEVIAATVENVPDDVVEENVQRVLDQSFRDLDLTMSVSKGMVVIRGAVRDRGQILQIADTVRVIDGVRGVDTSLLTVEGGEKGDRIGTRAPSN